MTRVNSRSNMFSIVFLISFFVSFTKPVQLPNDSKQTLSKFNNFNVCLKPDHGRPSGEIVSCFGHQMLQRLQDLEDREEFQLADGISFKRDESGPRDISNFLDKDPADFKSIVEGASLLMSRRAMQWDMSYIYPGLNMRIGPTLTGNGVLEFVMDPKIKNRDNEDLREVGTARLIAKQLLVPFLLGFKFQLSTLLPLLFGLMVLLSKKALVLAKIAVIASSFFGYNALFPSAPGFSNSYYGGPGLSAYGNRYYGNENIYKNIEHHEVEDNLDPYYGSPTNHHLGTNIFKSNPAQNPDEFRDRLERLFSAKNDRNNGRNFAWNE